MFGIDGEISELDAQRAKFAEAWGESTDNSLLAFFVRIMTHLLRAERCSIFIHDPSTGKIWLSYGTELQERALEVDMDEKSVVSQVVSTGETVIDNHMEAREGFHKMIEGETGFVTKHLMCLPIKSLDGSRIMGAIQLLNKTEGDGFSEDDRVVIEEVAHFLGLAVENIYFGQQASGVMHRLARTVKVMTSILVLIVVFVIGSLLWAGVFSG